MEAMTPMPAPGADLRPATDAAGDGAAEAFAREAQKQRQDAADPDRDEEGEAGEREQDRSRLPAALPWQPPLPAQWNAARLSAGGRHAAEAALSAPGKRGQTLLGDGERPDAHGKSAARQQGAHVAALAAQHAASLAPLAAAAKVRVAPAAVAPPKAEHMPLKMEQAPAAKTEQALAKGETPPAAALTPAAPKAQHSESAAPMSGPASIAAREGGDARKSEAAPVGAVAAPPQPQAQATATPPREAAPPARPRQDAAPAQPAPSAPSAPEPAQPGLTYRFQRWGGEHAVNVQSQPGGVLSLQPSDSLVQQRLGEQWQSGNPQQWQMARDDGREQGRQQPQRDEEEDA
ncbi:type III secretion system needle length determinant, SpaN/EivJ family [Chromobacterium sp.]|uniref:SpaN/EivJ family type III secretion system needle length determinant n=1 Tax=Chromobacterium sp. TaxID=306190 RepID=UPI0035B40ED1